MASKIETGTHPRLFTLDNVAIILSLCFGSITYGFDFSVITFTIGQPAFYDYMGLTTDATDKHLYSYSNNIIGTFMGLFSAGAIFGALFTGWFADTHGRKKVLALAAVINIVGGAIQTASVDVGMFIAARFITGFSAAMFVTLVPIYIAEVAPPSIRGLLVGQHGAFFLVGYSLASWSSVGSFYCKRWAQFQWRFPLSLQILWPIIVLLFVWKIPESPRWLIRRDRLDEAWAVLKRIHRDPNNPDASEASARYEYRQVVAQIAIDQRVYGDVSVLDLFRKPHFRKRLVCSAIVMFTSQACGNLVIYSNITILVKGLGFTAGISLVLGASYITWACVCNFLNASFLDRLGRVRSMLIGFSCGGIMVAIEAAIVAVYGHTTDRPALSAGVFILFCYITTFAGFCDTTLYVYCSEIFPTHIRSMGMAWSIAVFMLSTIPFLESSTVGFANLGYKYYMIFIAFAVVCVVVMALVCPETKGLSLEEINALFSDEVAIESTVQDSGQVTDDSTSFCPDTPKNQAAHVQKSEETV